MSYTRQKAITLKAATIAEVLTIAGFTQLLQKLTATQRQQLQRYLDALVVDPVVRKEADAWHHMGTKRYGQLVVVDPAMKIRADKVMRGFIPVGKHDDRVRLNVAQLLDEAAFVPKTDNPDEVGYLERVYETLNERGVWLRLAPRLVRDTDDPSRWVSDPRHFEVWLSLGPDGDHIPTKSGRIDREALLATRLFSARAHAEVDNGPVQKALWREARRLQSEIEDGRAVHQEVMRMRLDATTVSSISDWLGGASFDYQIWRGPEQLLRLATDYNVAGKTYACRALLIIAAIGARNAAHLVEEYIEKTTAGAQVAVKILKVARTAGHIAEAVLVVAGIGALVMRAMSTASVPGASLMERYTSYVLGKDAEVANAVNQAKVVFSRTAAKSAKHIGRVSGQGVGTGFHIW
jgi:hypothetical protein